MGGETPPSFAEVDHVLLQGGSFCLLFWLAAVGIWGLRRSAIQPERLGGCMRFESGNMEVDQGANDPGRFRTFGCVRPERVTQSSQPQSEWRGPRVVDIWCMQCSSSALRF